MKPFSIKTIPALLAGICVMVLATINAHAYAVWDSGFNPGGYFSSGASFMAIAVQSDGKVLFGGNFVYYGKYPNGYSFTVNNLVRFNTNGTVDTSFAPNPNYTVRAMALQSDGKILIGGVFGYAGGYSQTYICRLHPGGSADYNTFQAPTPNGYINAIALTSDEKVVIGGEFTTLNGSSYQRVACLNTNGSIVTSFNPGVTGSSSAAVHAIAVHPTGSYNGGNIIIGGDFSAVGGISRYNCARLYASGGVDSSFAAVASTGSPPYLNGPVYAVGTAYGAYCAGGSTCEKVFVAGTFTGFKSSLDYFARLENNGSADINLSSGFTDGVIKSMHIYSNGQVLLGGNLTQSQGNNRNGATRLSPSAEYMALDANWSATSPNLAGGGSVEAVGVGANGTIYIGGSFNSVEGNARTNIARLSGAP